MISDFYRLQNYIIKINRLQMAGFIILLPIKSNIRPRPVMHS